MVDVSLPVKVETEEKFEYGWGCYHEYHVVGNDDHKIATFYKKPLADGYVSILNSLLPVEEE